MTQVRRRHRANTGRFTPNVDGPNPRGRLAQQHRRRLGRGAIPAEAVGDKPAVTLRRARTARPVPLYMRFDLVAGRLAAAPSGTGQ